MIITRFAPSPTGELHVGGARTALFNFLYSKNQKGKFLLRIEDTDKERSKKKYVDQIIESLKWLGITFDNEVVHQSENIEEHKKVADILLEKNYAYKCFDNKEYIKNKEIKKNSSYVVRLKIEKNKKIILNDGVQGLVEIDTNAIEDFIILRSDGTPTYNLSASVDDKIMNITHVIRGDDHKINAIKQIIIFQYMGWKLPKYYHIPLIHSEDGKKLSKRDNASTTADYRKIGILPKALRNYLLKLGWSYKEKEIFSYDESIKLFNLKNIGKSPSKLDFERIKSLNEYYIKNISEKELSESLLKYLYESKNSLQKVHLDKIIDNINILKNKSKTLEDIYLNSNFIYNYNPVNINKISNANNIAYIKDFFNEISNIKIFDESKILEISKLIVSKHKINFKDLGQPLRLILTGSSQAPSIKDIIKILGMNETKNRLSKYI
tara:strand:+ start:1503 stop:2813 length:1311 start_codon:yes stop_codon:yes gene_type:complete